MKTKIIYISGNEAFEMTEIRAAFEEVREALGLDKDTILFGVPVDCDNALGDAKQNDTTETCTENTVVDTDDTQTPDNAQTDVVTPIQSVNENVEQYTEEKPVIDTVQEELEQESVTEDFPSETSEKIIPILSVLAAKTEDIIESTAENAVEDVVEDVIEYAGEDTVEEMPKDSAQDEQEQMQSNTTVVISDINVEAELVAPETDEQDAEKVTISDMINDEAPIPQTKKTLEQLLESMTPLREDIHNNDDTVIVDNTPTDMPIFDENDADATDATLAQLASEFAENEDKIPVAPKTETHGKIGKLKNILPFKKAKRDDSGLMGDLFGWAGIAANDDDFSMPGFFTGAKKQGA